MPEDTTEVLLGKIVEGQKHIVSEQERQRDATSRTAQAVNDAKLETTIGFGKVNESIATITQAMAGHREETDRRFGEVRADVNRAHAKIKDHTEDIAKVESNGGGSSLKRDGALVGGTGGLAVIINRVLDFVTGGGGS